MLSFVPCSLERFDLGDSWPKIYHTDLEGQELAKFMLFLDTCLIMKAMSWGDHLRVLLEESISVFFNALWYEFQNFSLGL